MAVLKPNHAAQRARRQLVLTATIVLAGVAALWVLLRQPTQLVVNGAQQGGARCVSKALAPIETREVMGDFLEKEGFTVGAELGVQQGVFSLMVLNQWKSCKKYILVDAWAHQENYVESANVEQDKQEQYFQNTKNTLKQWEGITEYKRMFTNQAALEVADESLDWVYVDARHDYCGCSEDIQNWWPKVKPGGIMAGHDYVNVADIKIAIPHEDWGLCMNGTRHDGSVKGAVWDFIKDKGLTVAVCYREPAVFRTWMVRKPSC